MSETASDPTIGDLTRFAFRYLPKRYGLMIHVSRAAGIVVVLTNPDGDDVEPWDADDATIADKVLSRVNAAREDEGLKPVERTW